MEITVIMTSEELAEMKLSKEQIKEKIKAMIDEILSPSDYNIRLTVLNFF